MLNLNNFAKTGYTVIPNFLSADEVAAFLHDYETGRTSENKNYEVTCDLVVDLLTPGAIYTDTNYVDWQWHQDHESYYTLQQHRDYLNFYIIIKKQYPSKSGLSVVPLDRLERAMPNEHTMLINNGASHFETEGDMTYYYSDETGEVMALPVNIDLMKESPELVAGDLLLLRGDIIHRTQDNTSERVAVSIRCTRGDAPITRDRLLITCPVKRRMMDNNKQTYDRIFKLLDEREQLTARDLYGNMD
jgi:ectoine hydroxylase-related dioxygenase (phytanoyl-CoA dioxygenase family)